MHPHFDAVEILNLPTFLIRHPEMLAKCILCFSERCEASRQAGAEVHRLLIGIRAIVDEPLTSGRKTAAFLRVIEDELVPIVERSPSTEKASRPALQFHGFSMSNSKVQRSLHF